jgi:MFS family permease
MRGPWISIAYLAVWGYLLYGIGSATPYLRADLHLTDFEAGLHASALAVGVLAAGFSADAIGRVIRPGGLFDLAVASFVAGIVLVALAPFLAVSLLGAFLLGLGGGTLGTQVNLHLVRSGGGDSRRLMGQANAISMLTAACAPLVIGLAVSGLHAWRAALLLPIVAFLILTALRPRDSSRSRPVRPPRATLPSAYWFAWLLLVLGVSIEFSFVVWGSTIVGRRTGVSDADATLLASLFVAGMFAGRAAIGRGFGGRRSPRLVLSAGLAMAMLGAALVWISTTPAVSALGLFLGGLGTSALWPVGLTVAFASSPGAQLEASARATLASGVAVLVAPSALGLASDVVGVMSAWLIIIALGAVALAVLAVTPRRPAGSPPSERALQGS